MSKKLKIGIVILLVVTCIVAVIHRNSQETVSCMVIRNGDREISVSFEDLRKEEFAGELVDGKGTVTAHSYTGILLKDLLSDKGIDPAEITALKVTSSDNYSVEFTGEEIRADSTVYAAVTADGKPIEGIDPGTEGVQIIVFGDPDSRHCVRFAAILEIIA